MDIKSIGNIVRLLNKTITDVATFQSAAYQDKNNGVQMA